MSQTSGVGAGAGVAPAKPGYLASSFVDGVDPRRQGSGGQLRVASVEAIDPNPDQPRKVFCPDQLSELASSVAQLGIIQPLVVQESRVDGRYVLVAGERRLRAAKMAGLQSVPVFISGVDSVDRLAVAVVENIQRAKLNCVEEARAYEALIQDHGLTQEQCAKRVGKDRTSIANLLRILKLPEQVLEDLMGDVLSAGHAKALLHLSSIDMQRQAWSIAKKRGLSVRATESLCRSMEKGGVHGSGTKDRHVDADMEYLANGLRSRLKTKVALRGSATRGTIELSYFSGSELERLVDHLNTYDV